MLLLKGYLTDLINNWTNGAKLVTLFNEYLNKFEVENVTPLVECLPTVIVRVSIAGIKHHDQ